MNISAYIPFGKENAVTREYLCKVTGLDDRTVRDEISKERRKGCIILSSSEKAGYWQSDDLEEIKRHIRESDNRCRSEALRVQCLRKYVAEKEGEYVTFVQAHYRKIKKKS